MTNFSAVSIIVPCRNEALSIERCLTRIVTSCPKAQVLVVDGGSDSTGEIVKSLSQQYPAIQYIKNIGDRGKGHAIQVGIALSSGSYIAQIDSDLQFYPEELPLLLAPLMSNTADFVLGSRFLETSVRNPGSAPMHRTLGNRIISAYASALSGHQMTDILAGVKAWRREVTQSFELTSDSFSYETELPLKALKNKWRLVDVAVKTDARTTGVSSVSVVRVGLKLLQDIYRFANWQPLE